VVHDGRVTLNIHPQAVQGLELGDDWLLFSARFSGRAFNVEIPVDAVLAIYARENGQGIAFPAAGEDSPPDDSPPSPQTPPRLRIVK
jgi:stringent starvation protein B